MTVTYSNPQFSDEERRTRLYEGQVLIYPSRPESVALIEFAQTLVTEAFGALDPETAQHDLPVEKFAGILSELKPKFIHHPQSKELLQALLASFDCDVDKTYFDVPRLRSSTSNDYLTTGIAYAFHPHRDTWYSAPLSQVNWWIPVFEVVPENVMTFHPQGWGPVKNSSGRYDYYEWNRTSRFNAAQHIGTDTREQPKAEEPVELEPRVTLVPEPGGVMIFSGNQLHSSVPNNSGKTRYSIDFRTVHVDDVVNRREAPNFDCACTGTTLRDFIRVRDLDRMPEDVALSYEGKG
ncbi:phytanoyl-CoA dioxygenase family protein [Planotetraspora silvatica]|uniref:phytanoyl-CoA dioxygenase family protein n=1 Tax=Planotetraspora silvatica TaxID=234614 RepID=UPI001EF27D78|nr:phytanoyl-CoA dioxygenase family protein [Planotetraspora silvatica]